MSGNSRLSGSPTATTASQPANKSQQPQTFWRETVQPKLPGRVMKQNSYAFGTTPKPSTPTKQQAAVQHRRNNSTSFEVFAASCDDAWDSKIERDECVSSNSKNPSPQPLSTDSNGAKSEQGHAASAAIGITRSSQHRRSMSASRTGHQAKSVPGGAMCTSAERSRNARAIASEERELIPVIKADPKLTKFKKLLFEDDVTDINQLRSMAWAGIPSEVRPLTWKMLLGYLPVIRAKREQTLERKRAEYQQLVHQYYNNNSKNDEMWRQIHIDIPRMQPLISIFQQEQVQRIFERILYIWSIRHPASGYVQGMNDLVTPFFVTYLSEFIPSHSLTDVETFQVNTLTDETLRGVEADSYWSFSKLLDSIQDNYTFAQPGIQNMVNLLARVVARVDAQLHDHLMRNSVQYLQFAFRWMNNLLIRELPLRCIVRLWDTYLAEGAVSTSTLPGLPNSATSTSSAISNDSNTWTLGNGTPFASSFHLFVCAAFLRYWSKNLLREKDFQGLMLLLQNLPTFHWTENEIKLIVADAYQLKYTFTPNHLN